MRASVLRRVERLETCFESHNVNVRCVDFGVLVDSELSYFSKYMEILRSKARDLGYGDGVKGNFRNVGWFDLADFDPMINEDVKLECFEALNEEEASIIEIFREVIGKALRLSEALSEEEKRMIREYNEALDHPSNTLANLQREYSQIMVKHGEKVFEQ